MIDFHSHILPALDDGAIGVDESIAMARRLVEFGYRTVCCTPHCIRGLYVFAPRKVREATLLLQADLDNADISLNLWAGMEYMLDESFAEFADDLLPLGETRLILCEVPQLAHPDIVRHNLELIISNGFLPLVAHPERSPFFYEILSHRNEERGSRDEESQQSLRLFAKKIWPFASREKRSMACLRAPSALPESCLFQANLGSFTGYYGLQVQRQAYQFLKDGLYTALASDLHDSSSAAQVLVGDKVATNPLLQKLARFDGSVSSLEKNLVVSGKQGQGELF